MKDKLRNVFQDLSSGKLSEEEALEKIKAIKQSEPNGITGTLISIPTWETRTVEFYSEGGDFIYEQQYIILVGMPHINDNEIGALISGCRCFSFLPTERKNIAEKFVEVALYCFERIQALLTSKPEGRVLFQVLVAGHGEKDLYLGLSGLLKTASLENPLVSGQVILTDSKLGVDELLLQLNENKARAKEQIVKYKHNVRHVLRLKELSGIHHKPTVTFKDNGVYLITGGLGGLGILFAKEINKQTSRAKIILVGRSGLTSDKKKLLDEISSGNCAIFYKQVDIEKFDQVNHLISNIKEEHNELNGILHCAGIISDNFILKKTPEEFKKVLNPKVCGTVNLDEATKDIDLDFMVLFSSVASTFGNVGQADYACANGFMDQYAFCRNSSTVSTQRRGKTVSINWPLWEEGGMNFDQSLKERMQDVTGIYPLQTSNGMRSFHQVLSLQMEQALVTDGDLAKMRCTLFDGEPIQLTSSIDQVKSKESEQPLVPESDRDTCLIEQTQEYLRKQFSIVLKLPSHKIDINAPLEQYGIDSILALNLTSHMEKAFGSLSKTLFFEYQTIHELADYFTKTYSARLVSLLSVGNSAGNHAKSNGSPVKIHLEEDLKLATLRRFTRQEKKSNEGQCDFAETSDLIAIVGISGRYPEAENIQEYWRNLRDGRDCITEIPKERWDWQEFYSEDRGRPGHHYSKWGGFISGVDEFDPKFFNISPREALSIDPQERLFLQHAWMAIEDAGYTRAGLQIPQEKDQSGQVGVYVGVMYGEYNVSGSLASIANRVSYVFNLHGPSITLDTMCSSSLTAIHLACQDLKLGRTGLAIAGGVNVSIHPGKYTMLSAGHFISGDGNCQSFGEGGDGYIPGEGVGVVVLKRLSEAEHDGDHIYGIIRGSVINHGGKTNGYTVPNPQAQASAISRALSETNTNPRHVSYIEAHGTGTKLGDPIEIAALTKAFQQHTQDIGFCLLGSAKSNIGHCESAAGVAGLTKVLLQMNYQQIVPSLHSERLNPNIDFKKTPFIVNQKLRAWEQPMIDGIKIPRIAGISSFGAGGSNAHIILQEHVKRVRIEHMNNGHASHAMVVLPLSARTVDQLKQKAKDLLEFIEISHADEGAPNKKTIDLYALAYTLQAGREAMEERLGFLVNSISQLEKKLRAYINGDPDIEDYYQGQVKNNRDTVSQFTTDADLQETLNKWIGQKKFSKLLDWWVKGLDLDWNRLYGEGKPPRLSLPVYPFARERYWIDPVTKGEKVVVGAPVVIHPMVHENTSDLQQHSYSSNFSGDEFFIKDCQVNFDGLNVQKALPIMAGLEMARVAVEKAMPSRSKESRLQLYNVIWAQPIVIDRARKVSIALFAINANQTDFEIYSLDNSEDSVYCQGHAIVGPISASGKLDLYKLKEEMNLGRLGSMEFYTWFTAMGLHYGANYQVISTIHRGHNQFLAELQLPPGSPENTSGGFVLHPSIMESIMQTSVGVIMYPDQSTELPLSFTFDSMNIISTCTKNMYVYGQYSLNDNRVDDIIKLDVDLCDSEGNICVQLKGVGFQREYTRRVQNKPGPPKLKQGPIGSLNAKLESAAVLSDSAKKLGVISEATSLKVTGTLDPVKSTQALLEKPVISLSGL